MSTMLICCLLITVAPSKPENLQATVKSSTSILLSWKPPLNPNGKITKYTVKYGVNQQRLSNSVQTTGTVQQILITNLNEYTMYYFLVYGQTTQMTGQSSQIVSAKTFEDGNIPYKDLM